MSSNVPRVQFRWGSCRFCLTISFYKKWFVKDCKKAEVERRKVQNDQVAEFGKSRRKRQELVRAQQSNSSKGPRKLNEGLGVSNKKRSCFRYSSVNMELSLVMAGSEVIML